MAVTDIPTRTGLSRTLVSSTTARSVSPASRISTTGPGAAPPAAT